MSRSVAPINVHVGSPSPEFHMEDVKLVHFHNFESLTTVMGEMVESPEFECAGHKWKLRIYPGGHHGNDEDLFTLTGFISVNLLLSSSESSVVEVNTALRLKTIHGGDYYGLRFYKYKEYHGDNVDDHISPLVKRISILNDDNHILKDGTLTIEVRIRLHPNDYCHVNKPAASVGDNMMEVYLNENEEDVAFKAKEGIVKAHRIILKAEAKELAELSETYDVANPMPVEDVDLAVLQLMIDALYGKRIDAAIWRDQSESILKAAGKYGFNDLRTEAAAWYLKGLQLEVGTVINTLLYADSNSLPLVKNTSIKFIVENAEEVMESESFLLLRESPALMTEVMKAMAKQIPKKAKTST